LFKLFAGSTNIYDGEEGRQEEAYEWEQTGEQNLLT
jgi:hypothetical protein